MQSYKITPPTYLLTAMLAAVALHFALPIMTIIPAPWTLLGILPIVPGIVINLQADRLFHLARTAVNPFDGPTALVTHGPYRYTRNPMYLSFTLVLLGIVVIMGSLAPFLIVFVFGLVMDRVFIRMEERNLAVAFGSAWADYKSRTRRWL